MPNHIQNKIQFIGDRSEVEKVIDSIRGNYNDGGEIQIDFNKIRPCPDGMDINSDGWLMPLDNKFLSNTRLKEHLDKLKEFVTKNPSIKEETIENFFQGLRNYINHGHATWYSWNTENWGTKWNAYNQNDERNTEDTIYFQTAWCSPVNLISELSNKFPCVIIKLCYADEDSGCNTGRFTFSKGETIEVHKPINRSNEAYELYFELHPERKKDYQLVEGKYKYIDNED